MFLFISSSPEPEVNLQDRYKTSLHVFVVARYRLVFKVKSESEVIGQHFHDANTAKAKITFPVGAEDNPPPAPRFNPGSRFPRTYNRASRYCTRHRNITAAENHAFKAAKSTGCGDVRHLFYSLKQRQGCLLIIRSGFDSVTF